MAKKDDKKTNILSGPKPAKKKSSSNKKPSLAKGRKAVKAIAKQQIIGFKNRTLVFAPNVRVEITDAEFKSRDFQARFKKHFMEVS